MSKTTKKPGFTLTELMVTMSITVIVIGSIVTLANFANYMSKSGRAKSNIMNQLEICLGRIQKESRLTDAHQIYYYPSDAASYSAISFPLAVDDNGDGFIEIDPDTETIAWDQTIIYHTYINADNKVELRRTVFSPRVSMSNAQRQQQLDEVVENGHPVAGTPNYANWDPDTGTQTLCVNDDITFTITPSIMEFDGYGSSTSRSENVTFGSVRMASGEHYITFTITGKNSLSSGYEIGIDSFAITPSGCTREAEESAIYDSDSSSTANEEMLSYGSWSGNRQLEYQSSDVSDYVSFSFNYDEWLETNFASSSPNLTAIEYGARTGDSDEVSGTNNYISRLGGYGNSWSAGTQTGAAAKSSESISVLGVDGIIFRNVILSRSVDIEGRAIKIKFDNAGAEAITIDYAGIMARVDGPNGDGATLNQITFDGGATTTVIGAGGAKESDWVDVNNFDRSKDYLLTFHIPFAAGAHTFSSWTTDDGAEYSYILEGDTAIARQPSWSAHTPTTTDSLYTTESVKVSYFSSGTLTSQIYDTGVDDPAYGTLTWSIAKNNYGDYAAGGLGADAIIRVRSNDSEDALKAAVDWSGALAIDTMSATTGNVNINSIGAGRYVQFQAEFISQPSIGGHNYVKSCVMKNLSINWPGASRIVDISGYLTRRPDYGKFSVSIDGYRLTKGIEFFMEISENLYGGSSITKSLTIESEARNTGK